MTDPHAETGQPEWIGPYRVLQVLGEGGMGTVYEAEQTAPVRRRVALKVMKTGMDTREVVARFEAERQALAVMNHPGIAKVFDAGASDTGRPYFVMELVKGIPLTDYCDQRKLAVRERLELYIAVCQAVQHAHQKGVIHRDLKPSNILVAEQDGVAAPKIIDFGIAKAVSQRLTEQTLVTAYGTAMGTLAYMSPEQAEMSALDVDTRADIYSLGVMLYELLVGELPVDPNSMAYHLFVLELLARETEAPRPSVRVSTAHNRERIAELRATDSGALRRTLRGDLDWIALKAMEKDRNRRYETASGLAADLGRYLRNEPVTARPPTTWYRFAKFARRNRVAVAAGGAVAAALVAGVILATAGLVRATRAESVARQEAETARQVSEFLTGLFAVSDPSAAAGVPMSAREILDQGALRIRTELADRPAILARLMLTMGIAYQGLSEFDRAEELMTEALERQQAPGAAGALDVARTKSHLAHALVQRGEFARSERLAREALAVFDSVYGDAYADDKVRAVNALAFGWLRNGSNLVEGERLLRRLDEQQRALGVDEGERSPIMDLLCWTLIDKGDLEAARSMCEASLGLRRRLFPHDHFAVAVSLQRFGVINRQQGRYDEALAAYREALGMNQRLYGPAYYELGWQHYDLSLTFRAMGRLDSAAVHAREAVRIWRAGLAGDNPQLAQAYLELAIVANRRGDRAGAVAAAEEGLRVRERIHGGLAEPALADRLGLIHWRARHATLLRRAGRGREAEIASAAAGRELAAAVAAALAAPEVPPLVLNALCWWGSLAGEAGRVLAVCDRAVATADAGMLPRIRDSRGVARSVTGDHSGAAEDFEAYLARPADASGVPRRQQWVAALRQGRNPFTREELDQLVIN